KGRRLNCLSAGSVSLTAWGERPRVSWASTSQLPFGWVCFSNGGLALQASRSARWSQLPFGWVCFSNVREKIPDAVEGTDGLNCLSAGSVSLTFYGGDGLVHPCRMSQLPFGWVCFSNQTMETLSEIQKRLNCLSAGSVSLTRCINANLGLYPMSQLPFGWVCFSNYCKGMRITFSIITSLNCLSAGSVSLTSS